jgi:hypothetical protein
LATALTLGETRRPSGSSAAAAYVDTERDAPLGGLLRYALRRRGGRWLIDGVERKDGNDWTDAVL